MSKTADRLATAVAAAFRRQRRGDPYRALGAAAFAKATQDYLFNCYVQGLKAAKGKLTQEMTDRLWMQAQGHARFLAETLNDSTRNMLDADRALGDVFGTDRAALVAIHEDQKARGFAAAFAVRTRGGELEWVTGSKPCKLCAKLKGKRRRPGKAFAVVNGMPIYTAPAHPHCVCEAVERRA